MTPNLSGPVRYATVTIGVPGYLRQYPASDEVPDVAVAGGSGQHALQCVKMDLERLQVVDHVLR
jgi:hypothetical protein